MTAVVCVLLAAAAATTAVDALRIESPSAVATGEVPALPLSRHVGFQGEGDAVASNLTFHKWDRACTLGDDAHDAVLVGGSVVAVEFAALFHCPPREIARRVQGVGGVGVVGLLEWPFSYPGAAHAWRFGDEDNESEDDDDSNPIAFLTVARSAVHPTRLRQAAATHPVTVTLTHHSPSPSFRATHGSTAFAVVWRVVVPAANLACLLLSVVVVVRSGLCSRRLAPSTAFASFATAAGAGVVEDEENGKGGGGVEEDPDGGDEGECPALTTHATPRPGDDAGSGAVVDLDLMPPPSHPTARHSPKPQARALAHSEAQGQGRALEEGRAPEEGRAQGQAVAHPQQAQPSSVGGAAAVVVAHTQRSNEEEERSAAGDQGKEDANSDSFLDSLSLCSFPGERPQGNREGGGVRDPGLFSIPLKSMAHVAREQTPRGAVEIDYVEEAKGLIEMLARKERAEFPDDDDDEEEEEDDGGGGGGGGGVDLPGNEGGDGGGGAGDGGDDRHGAMSERLVRPRAHDQDQDGPWSPLSAGNTPRFGASGLLDRDLQVLVRHFTQPAPGPSQAPKPLSSPPPTMRSAPHPRPASVEGGEGRVSSGSKAPVSVGRSHSQEGPSIELDAMVRVADQLRTPNSPPAAMWAQPAWRLATPAELPHVDPRAKAERGQENGDGAQGNGRGREEEKENDDEEEAKEEGSNDEGQEKDDEGDGGLLAPSLPSSSAHSRSAGRAKPPRPPKPFAPKAAAAAATGAEGGEGAGADDAETPSPTAMGRQGTVQEPHTSRQQPRDGSGRLWRVWSGHRAQSGARDRPVPVRVVAFACLAVQAVGCIARGVLCALDPPLGTRGGLDLHVWVGLILGCVLADLACAVAVLVLAAALTVKSCQRRARAVAVSGAVPVAAVSGALLWWGATSGLGWERLPQSTVAVFAIACGTALVSLVSLCLFVVQRGSVHGRAVASCSALQLLGAAPVVLLPWVWEFTPVSSNVLLGGAVAGATLACVPRATLAARVVCP